MSSDDFDARKASALKAIEEANATLAQLQRARLQTLMESCLPAYDGLRPRGPWAEATPLSVDPSLLRLASSSFNPSDFSDQSLAHRIDRAVDKFSKQLEVHRKSIEGVFDAFISYNSEDRRQVETVAKYLRAAGLNVWLDREQLRPGEDWQSRLQAEIENISGCIVVVGGSGIGPWQRLEVQAALQLFVDRKRPLVPVLLPTSGVSPELPLFLRSLDWIDFRSLDPDPVEMLVRSLRWQMDA